MPSKRANAKRDGAQDASDASADAPSSGQRKSRKNKNALPMWLWGIVGVAVVVVLGSFVDTMFSGSSTNGKKGGKKAEAGSTQAYLKLALRLSEMTQIATALKDAGELSGDAAETLNTELTDIESEIEGMTSSVARDLRSMVSVIRGTLYQQSHNLTDEQVEKMNNSFTYANPRYWDEYYKKTGEDERFDWYVSWDTKIKDTTFAPMHSGEQQKAAQLSDIVKSYLKPESNILMLGCGNSDMSAKMYTAGFEQIVNIDISESLMQSLREKQEASMPKMKWMYMNASDMTFDTASFDVTVDKGTLDAMEQNKELVRGAVRESHRILRPGGLFVSITFNSAAVRVENQLQKEVRWNACYTHPIEKITIEGKETSFFVHVCVKP